MIDLIEKPPRPEAGSFRDPSGSVFLVDGRVFRTVNPLASQHFDYVRTTGLTDELIAKGWLLPETRVESGVLGEAGSGASYVLEHPRLTYVSYPYEWPFGVLKDAALLHLDLHLRALDKDVTLSDASAYNIQFQGPRPVFIDHLSFRPYRDGEYWSGHGQFCQQFLNPLLLRAHCGIPHNSWYRGSQEGIEVTELNRVLPLRSKLSWNVLTHVVLQARFQQGSAQSESSAPINQRKLPKAAYRHMLGSLRRWIARLEPADRVRSVWRDYAKEHSYSDDEVTAKKAFVGAFAGATRPRLLWDLGCNTGDYSKVALQAGAEAVIGFDFDQGALELAYARAMSERLNFLPLFLDATNPTPDQGWAQRERRGLGTRASADGLLALALVHHLAIARNVPLDQVVDWLTGLAPSGVIEFVPKNDAMVQRLLRLREDIFPGYTEENFLRALRARAQIVREQKVSQSGRLLVWYQR